MHLAQTGGSPRPVLRQAPKQNGSSVAAPNADRASAGGARPRSRPPTGSQTTGRPCPVGPSTPGGGVSGRPVRLSGAGQGRGSQHRGRWRRKSRSATRPCRRRLLGWHEGVRQAGGSGRRHLPPPAASATASSGSAPPPPHPGCLGGARAAERGRSPLGGLPTNRRAEGSPLWPRIGLSAAEVGGPAGRRWGSHIYRAALFKRRLCGRGGWRVRGTACSACGPLGRPLAREGLPGSLAERGEPGRPGVAAPGLSCPRMRAGGSGGALGGRWERPAASPARCRSSPVRVCPPRGSAGGSSPRRRGCLRGELGCTADSLGRVPP